MMTKRMFAVLLCCMLLLCLLPGVAFASTTINRVALTLQYPEAGKVPPGTATWYGEGYSVYAVDWYDRNDDRFLEPGDKIQAGHQYRADIWVMSDDGYVFSAANDNTPSISATVNGVSVTPEKAFEYKAWAMVVLSYWFSSVPERGWIKSVDLTIPAPTAGEKPYYGQYTTSTFHLGNVYFGDQTDPNMKNGLRWYTTSDHEDIDPNSNATFDYNTCYSLHCLVFPNEGYRFTDNVTVRINGGSAEATLDYDTFLSVTYNFPATQASKPHTHTPSEWRTTQVYHYKVCTTCGEMLEDQDHYGGKATCAEEGKCTACGYGYLPRTTDHTPSEWRTNQVYHYKACTTCGEMLDQEDHFGGKATCAEEGKCTACGYGYLPRTTDHTPSEWRTNQVYHYKACTTCGEMLDQEDHFGGKATCTEKGKCTACGYAYLPENEDHDPDTKWTACGGLYHAHLCKRCGAHCDPQGHEPGPAATETTPQTCKVCNYILQPVKDHVHKLTKVERVPATCTKEGTIEHYTCSGCPDRFADAAGTEKITDSAALVIAALGHTQSDKWGNNEQEHWRLCAACKEPMVSTQMQHDLKDGKCELCGYQAPVETTPPTTEKPTEATTPATTEKEPPETTPPTTLKAPTAPTENPTAPAEPDGESGGMGWLLPIVIGLVFFAAAVTATVLILKRKR